MPHQTTAESGASPLAEGEGSGVRANVSEGFEALLYAFVATASQSGEEEAAARLLVDWMAAHGYDSAYVDESGSAVGVIGTGPRTVVLLGHIDTFPGVVPVRVEGRLLYGRGAVDAKGPLCAFAAAASQAALPPDLRVVVIGATEEEARSSRGARHALTQWQPDACLIGEPSQWDRITLGYKGRLILRWQWRGPLAHSASEVATPAERAAGFWERARGHAETFNAGREGAFVRLDAALQEINSGRDGAFGWAEAEIGFRLPPGVDPHELAAALAPQDDAQVEASGHELAFVAGRDTAVSRALRGAIRAQGGQPRFVHKTGTSDMNVVGPVWCGPIAAYGPGDSALDHTPDEHIDLDEYQRAIAVLTDALGRM
ncbi:MAG: [LysW]-lysine hydrolase [Anaerolineae bacterium]|nr:[LysW]-lysine hydrolase [Anaerolineae bacterium]